jgi:outer membrane protein assembly factor BamD (BamD/ComL family)
MQALQSTWNEGASFAESGDYDAAIAVFSELKGTEYNDRAQERIDELSLTAAKIERRRAADLFVRSMKTDDLENRKELLVESRQVLKDILEKYPDVEVAEKVEGNVRTVEKKMNELDPMLLPELIEKEKQQELMQEPEFDGFETEPVDPLTPQEVPARQSLPVLPPQS